MAAEQLYEAAEKGDVAAIKTLLAASPRPDINWSNPAVQHGQTPLIIAAANGHAEVVQALLEAGAGVNHQNNHGHTPVFFAARNKHDNCVKIFIAAGADLNIADADSVTPLMRAAYGGNLSGVKLLVEAGADVNIKTTQDVLVHPAGSTALDIARRLDKADVVAYLETVKQNPSS